MMIADVLAILDGTSRGGEHAVVQTIEARLLDAPTALERAAGLAAWRRVWQREHPESRRGGDRKSAAAKIKLKKNAVWSQVAAKRLRLCERSVYDDAQTAEKLGRADIERLLGSPIDNNKDALRSFAGLEPPLRDKVFALMRARPDDGWDKWVRSAGLAPKPGSTEDACEKLWAAWKAAPAEARRYVLHKSGVPRAVIAQVVPHRKKGARQ